MRLPRLWKCNADEIIAHIFQMYGVVRQINTRSELYNLKCRDAWQHYHCVSFDECVLNSDNKVTDYIE